jgi:hypothetical protein
MNTGATMKKNKNIFWHIIEDDYKKKSQISQCLENGSDKVILIKDLQQKNSSVVEQLEKLHQPLGLLRSLKYLNPMMH